MPMFLVTAVCRVRAVLLDVCWRFVHQHWPILHADAPMAKTSNGGVDIAYRVVGDELAEPILIIMGLSASHRVWNPELIDGLAAGGYRVVLLDNRDVGQSSRTVVKGKLWLAWQLLKYRIGLKVKSPYALTDMAADAVAVLDALDIERVTSLALRWVA